jgi:hypothetical protein
MINYYSHINMLSDDSLNGMAKLTCLFNSFEYVDVPISPDIDDDLDEIQDHKSIPVMELEGFEIDEL